MTKMHIDSYLNGSTDMVVYNTAWDNCKRLRDKSSEHDLSNWVVASYNASTNTADVIISTFHSSHKYEPTIGSRYLECIYFRFSHNNASVAIKQAVGHATRMAVAAVLAEFKFVFEGGLEKAILKRIAEYTAIAAENDLPLPPQTVEAFAAEFKDFEQVLEAIASDRAATHANIYELTKFPEHIQEWPQLQWDAIRWGKSVAPE